MLPLTRTEAEFCAAIDIAPVAPVSISGESWNVDTRCAVYRFYHPLGLLLYVGVAWDVESRFRQHAEAETPWWQSWGWYEIAWYPCREYALGVEAHAIVAEGPAFNVRGRLPEARVDVYSDAGLREAISDSCRYVNAKRLAEQYGLWQRAEARAALGVYTLHDPVAMRRIHQAMRQNASLFAGFRHDAAVLAFKRRWRQAEQARLDRLADEEVRPPRRKPRPEVAEEEPQPSRPAASAQQRRRRGAREKV